MLGGLAALFAAGDSRAVWPPPESATADDMMDPSNWPSDPSYGFGEDQNGNWHNGMWQYFSFVPPQSGNLVLRPDETASGMSVDLAWRWSIGEDSVRIAITDSGIKWDDRDLIDRAWLNPGEMATHMPTHADSSACGGTAELTGLDCNGDGIFSVSDYAETPTLQPPAGTNPAGDVDQNGVLDAGDLIHQFSDGIDDDANGYVDDISGWDFMKDDNDPYDDTRYGHGTGEANDSVAEGNNGRDSLGVCPRCRFIAMRVGDSFIADVNAFAESVVYATDTGAKVIQCALGTINMNRFAQAALDYAYAHGVLAVTSMADENARHHNMPVTANHTLPVHAVVYAPGNKTNNVETFLSFNTCTNFGGQNLLSASGSGCSSEATGRLSGAAGLLFSRAIGQGLNPPLTPAEAQQVWFTTADDIDVPESRQPDSKYYWSQPGFDQRFGYGRINVNSALTAVKDHKIPPEVDIVRPYWFEVLYRDQVSDAVPIQGTIAAKRAGSYDYTVEWAPGVQPLDADFQTITSQSNVPATVVSGGADPLALLDIRTISTEHTPDPDSPHGENASAITVRVRAVAHYGSPAGDVPGEMRRTYYVHEDPDLVKGFPIYVGDSGESSPKLADIDGDGVRDIVYATGGGLIHVLRVTPTGPEPLAGFPFHAEPVDGLRTAPPTPSTPSYRGSAAYVSGAVDPDAAGEAFSATPAIADLDGDGTPEIVATTYTGTTYVVGHDGVVLAGWPKRLPEVPSCPRDGSVPTGPCTDTHHITARGAFASPVIEDMDGDGDYDIVQAAFDGSVYVWDAAGNDLPGWPVALHYTGPLGGTEPDYARVFTTPAVGDFTGDGKPEVLVGSNETLSEAGQAGAVYLLDGRGTAAGPEPWLPNWPVTMTSLNLFPVIAEGVPNSGVMGTFEGTLAAVAHGNASLPLIMPADPGHQALLGSNPPNILPERFDEASGETKRGVASSSQFGPLSKAFRPNTMLPLFSQPSLGDVDQDGTLDVVASGGSLNLAINLQTGSTQSALPGEHLVTVWSGRTGLMLPAAPFILEDFSFFNSQTIADLDGDDYPEVIQGSGGYFLHAWNGCGTEPAGWPKFTGQWIIPTAAVGDLDGDDKLEIVTGTRSGWLYAWHTNGRSDGVVAWESYHHDNRNTGNADTPLEQGDPARLAPTPLTTELCTALAAPPADLALGGGCNCTLTGAREPSPAWPAALAALTALGAAAGRRSASRRRRATRRA
ncbi:MAG: VCBS repeat-containing protein [Myxococcales bacterium]|nr:VCBS repeat-containing protein [Myxococcales bacterium]